MVSKDKIINLNKFNYEKLPEKLKHLRQMENYTQEYVANKLGISRQSYNHYEAGRVVPDINILFSLSELYHTPFESLFAQTTSVREHPIINQLEKVCDYSKEFLDFFNTKDNQRKYHFLSREEKELIFYFKNLRNDMKKEVLILTFIKYLLTQNQ